MSFPLDAKTRLRTRITLQAGLEYVATSSFLALYWWLGKLDAAVVLSFVAIALCNNTLFLGCIVSGLSKRFKDPSMTAIQMFASCGRDLFGMLAAPGLWYLFAFNLFIALPFGSLQFDRRTFAVTWLLVCVGLGGTLALLPRPLAIAFDTAQDKLVLWLFLSAALARLMMFNARISDLRSKLRNKLAELDAATRQLAEIATHDELTRLPNRREFNHRLAQEWERAQRGLSAFHVAIVDVDFFKQVNDRHGHPAGDRVLQEIAQLLSRTIRQTDVVARVGGEEFATLLIGHPDEEVRAALERLRLAVERHDWAHRITGLSVTVSIGAAAWQPGCSSEQVLQWADQALYSAKRLGRNRVEIHAERRAPHGRDTRAEPVPMA